MSILGAVMAMLAALVMPSTSPDRDTPQFDSGQVTAIERAGGGVYVGGLDLGVGVTKVVDDRRVWSAARGRAVWSLLRTGRSVLVGSRAGVQKFRPPSTEPVWTHRLNRKVTSLERIRGTRLAVAAGDFTGSLEVIKIATGRTAVNYVLPRITGRCCDNSGPTGFYRADMQPGGRRYIAVGEFTAVNGRSRSQAVMLRFGAKRARLVRWDIPLLHQECGPKFPSYLRDAEWSHNGRRIAFVSSGGGRYPDRLCDVTFTADGTATGRIRPDAVSHTCRDTLHSVEWAPDDRTIFAAGHQKCAELTPGSFDYRPRYGIHALRASDLHLRHWRSDKCRGVGARELTWASGGLWVGYDCRFWGNDAGIPGSQFQRSRLAFLPRR